MLKLIVILPLLLLGSLASEEKMTLEDLYKKGEKDRVKLMDHWELVATKILLKRLKGLVDYIKFGDEVCRAEHQYTYKDHRKFSLDRAEKFRKQKGKFAPTIKLEIGSIGIFRDCRNRFQKSGHKKFQVVSMDTVQVVAVLSGSSVWVEAFAGKFVKIKGINTAGMRVGTRWILSNIYKITEGTIFTSFDGKKDILWTAEPWTPKPTKKK